MRGLRKATGSVEVKIIAASAKDPVMQAARVMGFSSCRVSKKGFSLRYTSDGPGMSLVGFVEMINYILDKNKLPGDKMFTKPMFNGRYVCTSSTLLGTVYVVEFAAGSIVVTKTKALSKKNKVTDK